MDPKLKRRLVGATVLSALAVIFVPMLFEDSKDRLDPRDFEIPEIPAQIEQNRVEPPEELKDIEPPEVPMPTEKKVQPPATEEALEHEKKPPLTAWVIQVGSFGNKEHADQLRDQLRKAGYPAYVESGTKRGAALYRVRVGPELDHERARSQRDTIAQKFSVKGIVLPAP